MKLTYSTRLKISLVHLALILVLWIIIPPTTSAGEMSLTDAQRNCLRKAERHEKNGWTYLHVEGTAHECGFQHGFLLAKEIADSMRIIRAS